ncbi:MAG: heme-binding domain-containing protein, partial [Terracidiphilus sp.]
PAKHATAEFEAPIEVKHIFEKDCYSCHSDQRRLSWFDEIVPAYWLVRHDILTAREHLNFSTLGFKSAAAQKATLYEAINMIQLGAMPLPSFVKLHREAKVTPEELTILKMYLAPWTPALTYSGTSSGGNGAKTAAAPAIISGVVPAFASLATVRPPSAFARTLKVSRKSRLKPTAMRPRLAALLVAWSTL